MTDSDGDGVPNHLDYCATQAPGANFLQPGGCTAPASWNTAGLADPDGDRVPSLSPAGAVLDQCPSEGSAGLGIDRTGCPIVDTDSDGIENSEDSCVDQGSSQEFGLTAAGCPIVDRDGDSVPDGDDACPDEPGARKELGCSI